LPFVLEDVAFHHRDAWGRATGGGVQGISFSIEPGAIICLTGPNGSGKSTIIKLCLGLAVPVSGVIRRPRPFRPGYIGDGGRNLYPHLTVSENLEYLLALRGWRKGDALDKKLRACSELLRIDGKRKQVGHMSRGMRQKASIVCALLIPHDYLLADEPTLGLDEQSVACFEGMLSDERSQGKGILLATNDPQLAIRASDTRIEVLRGTISSKEVSVDAPALA